MLRRKCRACHAWQQPSHSLLSRRQLRLPPWFVPTRVRSRRDSAWEQTSRTNAWRQSTREVINRATHVQYNPPIHSPPAQPQPQLHWSQTHTQYPTHNPTTLLVSTIHNHQDILSSQQPITTHIHFIPFHSFMCTFNAVPTSVHVFMSGWLLVDSQP